MAEVISEESYCLLTLVLLYDKFITTKGQVTIPVSVRQALKIKIGDKVSFAQIFPANISEILFGSLSSKVKEVDYKKARKKAGRLLAKKYKL